MNKRALLHRLSAFVQDLQRILERRSRDGHVALEGVVQLPDGIEHERDHQSQQAGLERMGREILHSKAGSLSGSRRSSAAIRLSI